MCVLPEQITIKSGSLYNSALKTVFLKHSTWKSCTCNRI